LQATVTAQKLYAEADVSMQAASLVTKIAKLCKNCVPLRNFYDRGKRQNCSKNCIAQDDDFLPINEWFVSFCGISAGLYRE